MNKVYNHKQYKDIRRSLRNNMTPAEAGLWSYLRGRKLSGRKFRRQTSVGKYIVDFYWPEEKLVIELDGEVHHFDKSHENDQMRDEYMNRLGITVLRLENKLIFDHLDFVLKEIEKNFKN